MADFLDALVTQSTSEQQEIRSPIIGRGRVRVFRGEVVTPGQIILDLYRLNKCYLVKMPKEGAGTVIELVNNDIFFNLAYGEVFLYTRPLQHASRAVKPKEFSNDKAEAFSAITAPMDGMFYLSAAPDRPPYVNVGDRIEPGQILGLIEVMKCFYPLKFQGNQSAMVMSVSIKSGTPVKSGSEIFKVST